MRLRNLNDSHGKLRRARKVSVTSTRTSLERTQAYRTRYESTAGMLRVIRVFSSISLSIATHLTVHKFLWVLILTAIPADVSIKIYCLSSQKFTCRDYYYLQLVRIKSLKVKNKLHYAKREITIHLFINLIRRSKGIKLSIKSLCLIYRNLFLLDKRYLYQIIT